MPELKALQQAGIAVLQQQNRSAGRAVPPRHPAPPRTPVAEHARQARTRLAQRSLRAQQDEGTIRPDVVQTMRQALATFEQLGPQRRQDIAVEIALKGQSGLDINDPEPRHTLKSLPGQFSALQLVSIMDVAFRQIDPTVDIGLDLGREFGVAVGSGSDAG